jgi:pSer/pThr/pTyr-binding forkhead associated (FHA) protein
MVKDTTISRSHAEIIVEHQRVTVKALKSKKPPQIIRADSKQIITLMVGTEAELFNGDTVSLVGC